MAGTTDRKRIAEIDEALAVFASAVSTLRSFTHPYECKRVGPLWMLADAPRKSGDYRKSEFIAHEVPPELCKSLIRGEAVTRYMLCAMHGMSIDPAPFVKDFKAAGFGYFGKEILMTANVPRGREAPIDPRIRRVRTLKDAQAIAKSARSRQILPQHLLDPGEPIRLYGAFEREEPVGWVRSVQVGSDKAWVSNLYVSEAFRRQGLGTALMRTLLGDDAQHGVTKSVLLASAVGAKLYPLLGYDQLGILHLFYPHKERRNGLHA